MRIAGVNYQSLTVDCSLAPNTRETALCHIYIVQSRFIRISQEENPGYILRISRDSWLMQVYGLEKLIIKAVTIRTRAMN